MSLEIVEQSPVLTESVSSRRCVQSGDREGWLALKPTTSSRGGTVTLVDRFTVWREVTATVVA